MNSIMGLKKDVDDFWNEASCGEELYLKGFSKEDYKAHSEKRYELEPEILEFADFHSFKDLKTLEIGVGLGSDHQQLAEAGADLFGIDLTERAINHTKRRFELNSLVSELQVGDAENLPFKDGMFDAVYSWGVLHHSPNTEKAIREVHRILKSGGFAKIMIYHKYSIIGFMLWIRYGLMRFRPFISLEEIYDKYLESPGTKAYSRKDAIKLFKGFEILSIDTPLNHGDLLTSDVGQRHRGPLLTIARKIWPRFLIKKLFPQNGLELIIHAKKIDNN